MKIYSLKNELIRWKSIRFCTLLVIWLLMIEDTIEAYLSYAASQGLRDSFVILPFMHTNEYFMKVIELAILCFYSNAPFLEKSELYRIQRIGRLSWGRRNFLYIMLSSLAFSVMLLFLSVLFDIPAVSFQAEWGDLIRGVSVNGTSNNIMFSVEGAVLNAYSPYELLAVQMIVDVLAFALIGCLAYVVSLMWSRTAAYIVTIVFVFLPTIASILSWTSLVYFSPLSWTDMKNWRIGYDLSKPSLTYIVAALLFCLIVLYCIGQYRIKRIDWNSMED